MWVSEETPGIVREEEAGANPPPALVDQPLGQEQVAAMLSKVTGVSSRDLELRTLLEVLYGSGLRNSELQRLSLEDVDLGRGVHLLTCDIKPHILDVLRACTKCHDASASESVAAS